MIMPCADSAVCPSLHQIIQHQSSRLSDAILEKSPVLLLTKTASSAIMDAAIIMSILPMGVPAVSSSTASQNQWLASQNSKAASHVEPAASPSFSMVKPMRRVRDLASKSGLTTHVHG